MPVEYKSRQIKATGSTACVGRTLAIADLTLIETLNTLDREAGMVVRRNAHGEERQVFQ
jgi:hypothetical protein